MLRTRTDLLRCAFFTALGLFPNACSERAESNADAIDKASRTDGSTTAVPPKPVVDAASDGTTRDASWIDAAINPATTGDASKGDASWIDAATDAASTSASKRIRRRARQRHTAHLRHRSSFTENARRRRAQPRMRGIDGAGRRVPAAAVQQWTVASR
jgi:hypothetical protein